MIFPELQGKLNGDAVRVPLLNRSLTDAVLTAIPALIAIALWRESKPEIHLPLD